VIGVVLAAGKGSRLRPLTETRPKVLIPILGKPVIQLHLELMKRLGVEKVVVVVSYLKEQVIEKTKEVSEMIGVEVEFVDQVKELGTGHALKTVTEKVEDDMVVSYGDLYIDLELVANTLLNIVHRKDNYVVGVDVEDVSNYGKLILEDDIVIGIQEKPSERVSGVINGGIYIIKKNVAKLVNEIKVSPRGEYELTDIVSIARSKGYVFKIVKISRDSWQDIGYPWDLLKAVKLELSKIKGKIIKGDVENLVTVKGPVVIEEGAIVKGATYIEGPVYIGKEVSIGPNSYLRPFTAIGEKTHIGFSVEVKESIVLENTHVAHLTYIGDSIIGENVNLGAGTIIANLRFDNKTVKMTIEGKRIDTGRRKMGAVIGGYVKTGVNVSVMPGVKIGSHSIIYPGVVVYRDVPPNTIVDRDWK
jgi:bifunctional UDP-N-acetylglucosamine pyrophosphorylase/glucosamine-1-phosphate N-acetyltransferase